MKLNGRGDLAAAELAFYGLAIILAVSVCFKNGLGRGLCWLYPILISILRIIGASCILYIETKNDFSTGLQTTAAITSAIGTAPLLMANLGFLDRINAAMGSKGITHRIFKPIHLVVIVALVLSIIGGTDDSEQSHQGTGKDLLGAGGVVFLLIWAAIAAIGLLSLTRKNQAPSSEKKLLFAAVAVLPLLLVRVVFSVCVGFSNPGSPFYFLDLNVWAEAFMMFLMEAITIIIYIWAGLVTPREPSTVGERAGNYSGASSV